MGKGLFLSKKTKIVDIDSAKLPSAHIFIFFLLIIKIYMSFKNLCLRVRKPVYLMLYNVRMFLKMMKCIYYLKRVFRVFKWPRKDNKKKRKKSSPSFILGFVFRILWKLQIWNSRISWAPRDQSLILKFQHPLSEI